MITDEIGGGGGGAGISGSALANLLTGYATQDWVGENYISIEFFSRLFQAHGTENGQQTDIDPNDMDSTITSIEALFGFWTDYYLSALGNGGGLGSTLYLSTLADVLISSPANNQVLTYNATIGKWVNANAQAGASALGNLTDVTITSPSANQVLLYDGTNSVWVNSALKTINGQTIYGSGDISVGGGASGNYLPLTGGTVISTVKYNIQGYDLKILTTSNTNIISIGSGTGSPSSGYEYGILRIFHNSVEQHRLYAVPDSAPSWVCYGSSSNFGIGTNAPVTKLDVRGDIRLGTPDSYGTIGCNYSASNLNTYNYIRFYSYNSDGAIQYSAGNYTSEDIICHRFYTYRSSGALVIKNSSFVGIGTTSPSGKLTVENGELHINSSPQPVVILKSGGANKAQYGFHDSYGVLIYNYNSNSGIRINNSGYVTIGSTDTSASYRLHVLGDIYATGAVTALSDARKKDVVCNAVLSVEQLALAPAILFTWKGERAKEGLQVGTLAQYWQGVLPEVVMNKGGELSMQYGVAALVSAIITARKVVDHERRISELEKENERLRTEVE